MFYVAYKSVPVNSAHKPSAMVFILIFRLFYRGQIERTVCPAVGVHHDFFGNGGHDHG
jgi:hypothetical protein